MINKYRCISLWQPWATLIAIGEKKIETRSWNPYYRGWMAIHAAKTKKALPKCQEEPFKSSLEGVELPRFG